MNFVYLFWKTQSTKNTFVIESRKMTNRSNDPRIYESSPPKKENHHSDWRLQFHCINIKNRSLKSKINASLTFSIPNEESVVESEMKCSICVCVLKMVCTFTEIIANVNGSLNGFTYKGYWMLTIHLPFGLSEAWRLWLLSVTSIPRFSRFYLQQTRQLI